ncbi:dihydrolipoyl dehydrogenase [Leeia sp. TBRC 13508]|uniref:Dihydrolipoyl dehydrogenase n=1 Tax=Leeia speluncae TaxID=2884804 RepID=A0ABS8D944_9NEIS|nr:dihydrolipoyl dehydrogenase [Leeia speluncae]MCB6184739.1 dihydrolipoyl dehydrogenase [Leeia speluncae]
MSNYDVVVIGAGPGGYIAAIRASQLGFKVACIDAWKNKEGKASLGGTCLNVGCIPSKALLQSSENFAQLQHDFADHGITAEGVKLDVAKMLSRKDKIVDKLTGGIGFLFKKNKIDSLHGVGRLVKRENDLWQVEVKDGEKVDVVSATRVIIATGSSPRQIPGAEVDNVNILDNEGALSLAAVPAKLGVIGAGVIGLEMGSVWNRLGSQVTILEAAPAFLGAADEAVAKEATKLFTKQGLSINTGVKINSVNSTETGVTVAYVDSKGNEVTAAFDKLIVAVGRVPNTNGLGAEVVGLQLNDRGQVEINDHWETNLPNVYAIGDVVRGPMLAHKAMDEGVALAEQLAGQKPHLDFNTIPWVIYTNPEIAWVGKTEQQLKADGVEYKVGKSVFGANGRALGLGMADGFVKVLACAKTDRVLGVHLIGPFASEMIAEAVMAMEFRAASEDIARIVHAHPSLSEVFHEAALSVDKRALHA